MQTPIDKAKEWLDVEAKAGSHYPNAGILATTDDVGIPFSRVIAIREMLPLGPLFFTQLGSNKVSHLTQQPNCSLTLWLSQTKREVIFSGTAKPLTPEENAHYWNALPRERQLKFATYGPLSGQKIPSKKLLEEKYLELDAHYGDRPLPLSKHYIGYKLLTHSLFFYTLQEVGFSDVELFKLENNSWERSLLSP